MSEHLTTVTGRKLGQIQNDVLDHYLPEVVTATDYYPFGSEMPGRTYENTTLSGTNDYRYAFNGKEHYSDGEFGSLTHYDYGFRIYNPSIGKFLSVDPLTKSYPWYTSYQFAGNTPIQAIDVDGLEPCYTPDQIGVEECAPDQMTGIDENWTYQGSDVGWTANSATVNLEIKSLSKESVDKMAEILSLTDYSSHSKEALSDNINAYINGDVMDYLYGQINMAKRDEQVLADYVNVISSSKKIAAVSVDANSINTKMLGTARNNLLSAVKNPKLKNIVNDLYRPGAKVGNGSSMDAFRLENLTGGTVGGKNHVTKLLNYRTALQRLWSDRANLSAGDRQITKQLLEDIQNALSGY